ncbi:hypothetical protein [Cellvibrio sp. NN19]|uniref:hypothetical protein n=1 Tax=Cellvibrio chitinivorans TaxID=3102792 RepID=UPI002B40D0A0|nr:hypothetical protein [Cellvibrio sp. NN19]
MSSYDYLIACTSWEERFSEGIEHSCKTHAIENMLLFGVSEFKHRVESPSQDFLTKLPLKNKDFLMHYVSAFDDVSTWGSIKELFKTQKIENKKVLLDISTMPRYLIWYLLHFLTANKNNVTYCYFSPASYEECQCLTDDPLSPRLIFKHSGIYLPDRSSILIVQSGFDVDRVYQLIRSYEPEKLLLGVQVGNQLNNIDKNIKKHKENLNYQEIEHFEVDAFGEDHGYLAMECQIAKYSESKNIIMASFGPKILAVEMFKLNKKYPEIGLVDVPVKVYNEKYSHGINLDNIQTGVV